MSGNISHQDIGTEIRGLHARLSRIENSPQVGHQSILDGSLNILDTLGRVLMILGNQPDGTVGVASYDPATGVKQAQMGQQAGGLYGLSVLNTASNKVQLVAGSTTAVASAVQSTSSTTNVTFGDDPVVTTVIGQSGQALVSFGAGIGTGGDNDEGFGTLTVDGVAQGSGLSGEMVTVSSAGVNEGVQAAVSRTSIISGIAPGTHTFSLTYRCLTGVHGISVRNRFVTVSAL